MLPKIWKKLLLAICIIACLFNVTSKLVNRISLEKVINSEQEGVNVKELLNITDEEPVVTKTTNSVSVYNTVENDEAVIPEENNQENISNEEVNEEQPMEEIDESKEAEPGTPGTSVTQEDFFDKIFQDSAFKSIIGN